MKKKKRLIIYIILLIFMLFVFFLIKTCVLDKSLYNNVGVDKEFTQNSGGTGVIPNMESGSRE